MKLSKQTFWSEEDYKAFLECKQHLGLSNVQRIYKDKIGIDGFMATDPETKSTIIFKLDLHMYEVVGKLIESRIKFM